MRSSALWRQLRILTRQSAGRRVDEAGDTLIEVLVAIVIIGLTAVALMGTLTTTITSTAEYRSLATVDTVLKNFAEAIKDKVQLAPTDGTIPTDNTMYKTCATQSTYQIATEYPTSVGVGAGVTVFGTGLPAGQSVSSIAVGSATITNFVPATMPVVNTDGTVSATFFLPTSGSNAVGDGTYSVVLTVGSGLGSVVETSPTALTVTPITSPVPPVSAVAGYHLAISSVGWWNDATSPASGDFTYASQSECLSNPNEEDSGIQMINLRATAPNNVSDTLGIVVSDPTYLEPAGPGTISVSAATPSTPPAPDQQITFTATVTGSNNTAPTGTLGWTISGGANPDTCSNANPTIATGSSGATSTWTCVLAPATVSAGTYTATVSYSGDGNYGPGTSSSPVTVSPAFTVNNIQLLGTPGQVAKGDSIAITFNAPIYEPGLCASWSGAGDQSLGGSNLLATITDGGGTTDDSLSLSRLGAASGCTTINFGSLDLGSSSFVNGGNVTFSGSNGNATKLNWTASSDTLTITLGSQSSGPGAVGTVTSNVQLSLASPITDTFDDPISPSPYKSPPVSPF
jgi:type II secretory pathway pseudopilin PulG